MWQQLVIQLILAVIEEFRRRKLQPALMHAPEEPSKGGDVTTLFEKTISELESAEKQGPPKDTSGQPVFVGHPGGIIQHVRELFEAYKAGDWRKVFEVIADIAGHL